MRFPTLSISLLSLAICASVTALQPLPAHREQQLGRRQITIGPVTSVPSACASVCGPVNDEIGLGCPVTACCTTTFETGYYNCLECYGMAVDATSYSAAQNSLNLLHTTCVDLGFVLPPLALPGQTASGSNSSSAPPASTGASPSAIATSSARSGSAGTSGAAITGRLRGVQPEALAGVAALLCAVGLW